MPGDPPPGGLGPVDDGEPDLTSAGSDARSVQGEPPIVDPQGRRDSSPGRNWWTVTGGAVLGMFVWFFIAFVAFMATYASVSGSASTWVFRGFVVIFVCAVGLIVWPRTRRLGEGFLLGVAIGLVVAGGVCIPMTFSAS